MAMTIQQLQDFSNTYPELRWLTEQIIDYLQANPVGGGGVQSVTGDLVDDDDPENPVIDRGYLLYTAIFEQASDTDDPTITILGSNTIGAVVWERDSPGSYLGTLNGAFPDRKTICPPFELQGSSGLLLNGATATEYVWFLRRIDNNTIALTINKASDYSQIDFATLVPGGQLFIEIRVYP